MQEQGEPVQLYVYDLSRGLARQLSPMLLGKQLEGIWHSAIVVGGTEYYYGFGINVAVPGQTPFGQPSHIYDMGMTFIPEEVRDEFLADLSERYTPQAYNLLHNNCNNFANELAQLLVGHAIPNHITGLPAEVLSTPFGQMMLPMLQGLERQLGSVQQEAFVPHPHPHAHPAAALAPPAAPAQPLQQAPAAAPSSAADVTVGAASADSEAQPESTLPTAVTSAAGGTPGNVMLARQGASAMDAAAEQIAAAVGLAMVEEAEGNLAEEGSGGAGQPQGDVPTASTKAQSSDVSGAAASGAASLPQPNGRVPELVGSQQAPAAPAQAPCRPARSAAVAAAAAAAERRAVAAAGGGGGTALGEAASGPADVPEGATAAAAAVEDARVKAACEEAVREEFVRLVAVGEMGAVEAATAAARQVAMAQAQVHVQDGVAPKAQA